jgi:hypothetical protein
MTGDSGAGAIGGGSPQGMTGDSGAGAIGGGSPQGMTGDSGAAGQPAAGSSAEKRYYSLTVQFDTLPANAKAVAEKALVPVPSFIPGTVEVQPNNSSVSFQMSFHNNHAQYKLSAQRALNQAGFQGLKGNFDMLRFRK